MPAPSVALLTAGAYSHLDEDLPLLVAALGRLDVTAVAVDWHDPSVEWAAHELLRSDKSIARIATEAGFTDQSHLTRVFVRHIGCAPGAYRKRSSSG